MASRALLAPPGARRGAAASTPYTYDAQKPSEHRRGRNGPGVLKLPLPIIAGAASHFMSLRESWGKWHDSWKYDIQKVVIRESQGVIQRV